MITEGIQDKPLAKFMSGKSLSLFLLSVELIWLLGIDQIKNVIESGQVYKMHHFESLLKSMDASDRH